MTNKSKFNSNISNTKTVSYQDYVINDGNLIGDWEGLYQNFEDPWGQSELDQIFDSRRILSIEWCKKLRAEHDINRVIEVGCGFGYLTSELRRHNFASIGTDISESAINKARTINKDSIYFQSSFENFESYLKFDPDIIIMSEVSWYVLDHLDDFLDMIDKYSKSRKNPTFLIHLLTTYSPGQQRYGVNKFTNLDEILLYFNLNFIESGFVRTVRKNDPHSQGTYFVAKI